MTLRQYFTYNLGNRFMTYVWFKQVFIGPIDHHYLVGTERDVTDGRKVDFPFDHLE